jgi:hypothetical protein
VRAIKTTTISILAVGLLAGSTVGAAAQDEEAADGATSFTGTSIERDYLLDPPPVTTPDGMDVGTEWVILLKWSTSDPRLTGEATATTNWVIDGSDDGFTYLGAHTYELSNDGGSWLGSGTHLASSELGVTGNAVLVGQDGYDGLTAYVIFVDSETVSGVNEMSGTIIPIAMPEAPEPYSAE